MHNFFVWLALIPLTIITLLLLLGGVALLIAGCTWIKAASFKTNIIGSLLSFGAAAVCWAVCTLFASICLFLSDKLW